MVVRAAAADLQVRVSLDAEVHSPGSASVPAQTFVDLVALLDDREVVLDDTDGTLRVQGFQVDTAFQIFGPHDVPGDFPIDSGRVASVSANDLLRACSRVSIAVAGRDTAPILTGALTELTDMQLSLVGADGRRLAIDRIDASSSDGAPVQAVLPGKLVVELQRILGSEGGDVVFTVDHEGRKVRLDSPTVSLRALALDGNYPKYRNLIPTETVTCCVVSRELLVRRLQAAATFAPEEIPSIHLKLQPGAPLVLSGSSSDRGATVAEVAGDVTGRASSLALHPRFLLDGLKVLNTEKVQLEIAEDSALLLIRNWPDDGFLYLLVPRTPISAVGT